MFGKRKLDNTDLAYMRSLSGAVMQRTPRYMSLVLLVFSLFIVTAVAWMNYAEIDVVVRGQGKVVPSQQLQVVQSLEGGVVSEILVREGDVVDVDQPVMKLSDIAFSSSLEENRLHYLELRARIARLTAESNATEFVIDAEVEAEAPELMNSERSLFDSNMRKLQEELSFLQEELNKHKNEFTEAQAKRRQMNRSLALSKEELDLKEPLVAKRLVSEVEFLQLKRSHNDLLGELENLEISIPRIQSSIQQDESRLEQSRLDFANLARRELNVATAEVSRIAESQTALRDRVQRTTVRSPVKGTVTRLHINTLGGVISAGGPIMEIVPYEDALLIEVQITPSDIANISTEQPARLKFSAYDFAIHGALDAKVQFLSADTITDADGNSYYVARLEPEKAYLGPQGASLPIRVGMTVEADIITGKKTILQYLLKPINRGLGKALRES